MKKKVLWFMVGIFIYNCSFAQTAKITETQVPLLTYAFSDPDPIPTPIKFYPYFRFEGYSDKGVMHNWNIVVLENNYIKLWVAPEIGGNIWGAIEKETGKESIYFNHVVKFRNEKIEGNLKKRNGQKASNRLLYETDPAKGQLKRPVEPAEGHNRETAYGWSLKEKEKERQHLYKTAFEDYKKSLSIEPNYVPTLNNISTLGYRENEYSEYFDYASEALSVDTYDEAANMNCGNAALALGDTILAMDIHWKHPRFHSVQPNTLCFRLSFSQKVIIPNS